MLIYIADMYFIDGVGTKRVGIVPAVLLTCKRAKRAQNKVILITVSSGEVAA